MAEPASLITRRSVRLVGLSTEIDTSLSTLGKVQDDPDLLLAHRNYHRMGAHNTFFVHDEPSPQSTFQHAARAYLVAIENLVGPCGPVLVDLYLTHVHPGLPVLERGDFLDRYQQIPSMVSAALLAAIYLLGMEWWAMDDRLRSRPPPDVALLEGLAYRSFEWAMCRPEISTVQAGLLLLQCSDGESWALTARLVAVAQDLGLHLDPSSWNIPVWERGLRKRVAWALFMRDKWGALAHGRPSHLVSANWGVGALIEDDLKEDLGIEPQRPIGQDRESSGVFFGSMVTLTVILSHLLDAFYTLQALQQVDGAGKDGARLVLERAKPIQIQLKDWFTSLPACLRMDRDRADDSPPLGRPQNRPLGLRRECSQLCVCVCVCVCVYRVTTPGVLCNGDHATSKDRVFARSIDHRSVLGTHLSIGRENTTDLGHGFYQSVEDRTAAVVVVFDVQDELCPNRDLWQSIASHVSIRARGRVLSTPTERVSLDVDRQRQMGSIRSDGLGNAGSVDEDVAEDGTKTVVDVVLPGL